MKRNRIAGIAALFFVGVSALLVAQAPDALQLYRNGRYNAAVQATLDEIEQMPRNMNAYSVLGWSLLAQNRNEEALEYGTRALAVARFDHRIVHIVAEANFRLNNNERALDLYQQYTAIRPQGVHIPQVYFNMGEIFIRMGEFNRADIAITTALHHEDENINWWVRLGYVREQINDHEYAEVAYRQALEMNPNHTAALQGLSRVEAIVGG